MTDFIKSVKNSMKNSLNDLLKLKANRIKKRDEKEDLFRARLDDFFSNFAYRSESTENYSFNSFKENNVNINDATTISNSMTEMTKKRKKSVLISYFSSELFKTDIWLHKKIISQTLLYRSRIWTSFQDTSSLTFQKLTKIWNCFTIRISRSW